MTVIGLSAGGVLSGWQAQQRDLAQALLISPAFDVPEVPDPLFAPAVRLASVLPNLFIPVDSAEDLPKYAYRHDGTRPVSAILLMGSAVGAVAMDHAPATSNTTVVTNANDETIEQDTIQALAERWRGQGAAVVIYEFPSNLQLGHDLIDPNQQDAQTDLVYPVLMRLLSLEP